MEVAIAAAVTWLLAPFFLYALWCLWKRHYPEYAGVVALVALALLLVVWSWAT